MSRREFILRSLMMAVLQLILGSLLFWLLADAVAGQYGASFRLMGGAWLFVIITGAIHGVVKVVLPLPKREQLSSLDRPAAGGVTEGVVS